MDGTYMQYGCGWHAPKEWLNFDASPTLRFERIPVFGRLYTKNAARFPVTAKFGDIVRGLPVQENSCVAIYCSHVLEHLTLEDCHIALSNTYKYLRAGGVFRLVVPDLKQHAMQYVSDESPDAAHRFMRDTNLGVRRSRLGVIRLMGRLLGNSAHLWMWDEPAMRSALEECGFRQIRRCFFGDASDPLFRLVEDFTRFDQALAIECVK